jgi:glycine hydroxymethyltransferase
MLYASLKEIDPEIQNIVDKESWRQLSGLELIASEVCIISPFYLDVDVG